jgi:L-seryl-tRNA(Ser) seleniumtransferase
MLGDSSREIELRCRSLAATLDEEIGRCAAVAVVEEDSTIGGGALPLTKLPGFAIAVEPIGVSVDELSALLRRENPPIIGRVHEERLLLNLRTVLPAEEPVLVRNLKNICQKAGPEK